MQTRQLRRAAERQAIKDARAAINRESSQHSTGPRSAEGKAISSQNSFKHGLYSKALMFRGENPAELDALKADLRSEHQPANTTEEILVNEMAEQFWRLRRIREQEVMDYHDGETGLIAVTKMMPIIQRLMSAAERGFYKATSALRQLQKDRGFVPHFSESPQDSVPQTNKTGAVAAVGFVPPNASPEAEPRKYSAVVETHWAEAVKHGDVSPDDFEVKDLMAADIDYLYGDDKTHRFASQIGTINPETHTK